MLDLPRGTITLLFTEIEGSTLLLQQVGEQYSHVLALPADFPPLKSLDTYPHNLSFQPMPLISQSAHSAHHWGL